MTHRWINADKFLDFSNFNGLNLFAYCLNNPINSVDIDGYCTYRFDGYFGHYDINCHELQEELNNFKPSGNLVLESRKKPNKGPQKDPRKGAQGRQPTGERERNVGHPDGEEHSRVPKGPKIRRNDVLKPVLAKNYYNPEHTNISSVTKRTLIIGGSVAVGYGIYLGVKWIIAGALAVPTGGGSLVVAALTP